MAKPMHLTCSECGTVRNEPFCPVCEKPFLLDAVEKRERAAAGYKFVESIGGLVEREEKVYCAPDSKVGTAFDRRIGYRVETVLGLPDSHRGETKWAVGALRFKAFDPNLDGTGPSIRASDEGVLPPNLDPLADV